MAIHVIEQFVEAKTDGRVCEDMIVVTDDFAAVIDGASDATGADFAGKTGGRFAAEVVATAISVLPGTANARGFADSLASALANAVDIEVGALDADTRWPVAVVICASAHRREVWRIGDGNVLIGGKQHTGSFRVNEAAYGFRAAVNAALLNKGMSPEELIETDPGAVAARELIDIQQHLANTVGPWGYGCINGHPIPDDFIEVLTIPKTSPEVIITSDGYPTVLPTLAETEAELREAIRRDPAAIDEFRSMGKTTKAGANAPDDRAYLRFRVE